MAENDFLQFQGASGEDKHQIVSKENPAPVNLRSDDGTDIDESNPLPVATINTISTANSRPASTLGASVTFQGVGEDVSNFARVGVSIRSDNATDGVLTIEVSHDNVLWGGPTRTWADTRYSQPHMWNIVEKYFRIKYVNGTTEAINLSIQVQYSNNASVLLGHQLDETLTDEAEATIVRAVLVGQTSGGKYVNIPASSVGGLKIDVPQTAFNELAVAEKTPQAQVKFPYGINPEVVQVLTNKSGSSVAGANSTAVVTAEGVAGSFSQLRTLDVVRYGPGQGGLFLGTCAFTAGVALSSQLFGPGDDDEAYCFGYNGTTFSLGRRYGGRLEVKHLEITGGGDAGGGDLVITLDGSAVTIAIASGSATISQVVQTILTYQDDFGDAGRGWEVSSDNFHTVEFTSLVAENATGAFSLVDTDSGVTSDAFDPIIEGVAPTDDLIAQADWNIDPMDGTGASGITLSAGGGSGENLLDITNLNVYKIQYRYLGAGPIRYFIEAPHGDDILVHIIHYPGSSARPSINNPTLNLNVVAKTESGYVGGDIVMRTSSMAGFIEGKESILGVRHSAKNTKSVSSGVTPLNVLTIHNHRHTVGTIKQRNKVITYPDFLTIASEASKTVTISLILNPTLITGTPTLVDIDAERTAMAKDISGVSVTGGEEIIPFTISGSQSKEINLKGYGLFLRPGDTWSFAATLSSGSAAEVTVGVTFLDRI